MPNGVSPAMNGASGSRVGNQRQGIGLGEAGDALALDEEAAAQRVLRRHLPAGIALHAGGEAGALRPRCEAVVQKVADRVGLVVELGIAREARQLHVDVGVGLLQRGDAEVGAFPLALVEDRAVPGGIAEHREVRNLVDVVGYLVARAGAAADEGEPRVLVDDARDLGEPIPLRGVVMDRRPCRRRISRCRCCCRRTGRRRSSRCCRCGRHTAPTAAPSCTIRP